MLGKLIKCLNKRFFCNCDGEDRSYSFFLCQMSKKNCQEKHNIALLWCQPHVHLQPALSPDGEVTFQVQISLYSSERDVYSLNSEMQRNKRCTGWNVPITILGSLLHHY